MIETLSPIYFALMTPNWVIAKLHLHRLSRDWMSPLCGGTGKRKSDCVKFALTAKLTQTCPSGPSVPSARVKLRIVQFMHLMGVHLIRQAPHGHASHRRDCTESRYRYALDNRRVGHSDSFNISMIECRSTHVFVTTSPLQCHKYSFSKHLCHSNSLVGVSAHLKGQLFGMHFITSKVATQSFRRILRHSCTGIMLLYSLLDL
jgi:hypothetical protein